MNQPLLALSNGELLRLSACLRSQPLIPNEAALNQQQIARKNPELRRALLAWLENWNHQGGSNGSLELTLSLLLDQRQSQLTRQAELVWSGPPGGPGDITRDQAILIREMVERCEKRLLITTFNIWRGGFIAELLNHIQQRMLDHPSLDARIVINIPRPRKSTVSADQLRQAFIHDTWRHLWDNQRGALVPFGARKRLALTTLRATHIDFIEVVACPSFVEPKIFLAVAPVALMSQSIPVDITQVPVCAALDKSNGHNV